MRHVLVALATASVLAAAAPASDAVPPWRFNGTGHLSPGVPGAARQDVSFSGVATNTDDGTLADCSWHGTGTAVGPTVSVRIAAGSCGPVSLAGCRVWVKPGWTVIRCGTFGYYFATVTYENANPTVSFQMQGVIP